MPCSPGMTACKADCGHRDSVQNYQRERERQVSHAEEVSKGYATEYAEFVRDNPLVTFHQWLKQSKRDIPEEIMVNSADRLTEATEVAWRYMRRHTDDAWVPEYMASRGMPGENIAYAPPYFHDLVTHLNSQGFTNTEIIDAGLGRMDRTGKLRDVFSDRLMFPVHSPETGMVIAFTGRKPPTDTNPDVPKYFNSATTELFTKADIPFGLDHETTQKLRDGAQLVIVEGPMDALAVRKARPDLAVIAPLGTALTDGQLATVDKIAPLADRRVTVLMDADAAGLKAAIAAHDKLVARGVATPETVSLPPGSDPAQYLAEHGPTALAVELTHRRPLSDVAVDGELNYWIHNVPEADCGIEHKFNAVRANAPMVSTLPPGEQAYQISRMAEVTGWPVSEVYDVVSTYANATSADLIDPNAALRPQLDTPVRARPENGLSSPMAVTPSVDPTTMSHAHGK